MIKKPFTIVFHRFPEQIPKNKSMILVIMGDDGSGLNRLRTGYAEVSIHWEHESDGDIIPHNKLADDRLMAANHYVKILGLDFGDLTETRTLEDKPFLWNYFSEVNKVATRAKI
jgi:hypothetical protein